MIDSNVLLDLMTEDPEWFSWSEKALTRVADTSRPIINPIIYAEVSVRYSRIEDLNEALSEALIAREPIPFEASFLAGKTFRAYRKRGATKSTPLPDFFIGAHAAVAGYSLLTRDVARYRTYFPRLNLICPG